MDCLLIGWKDIYQELFHSDNGKALISYQTLIKKHGPGLKAAGAVFKWKRTRARTNVIAGWRSVIQNYFILLGQQEDAERIKKKLLKQAVKADQRLNITFPD